MKLFLHGLGRGIKIPRSFIKLAKVATRFRPLTRSRVEEEENCVVSCRFSKLSSYFAEEAKKIGKSRVLGRQTVGGGKRTQRKSGNERKSCVVA
jgi:hypothetical protein